MNPHPSPDFRDPAEQPECPRCSGGGELQECPPSDCSEHMCRLYACPDCGGTGTSLLCECGHDREDHDVEPESAEWICNACPQIPGLSGPLCAGWSS